jgi:hypothetical protein
MRMFFAAGLAFGCIGLVSCGLALQTNTSPSTAEVKEVGRSLTQSCPQNYVWVPGNPTPGLGSVANKDGVPSFCIAKFEMKHPTDATGYDRANRDPEAVPVSQPQNKPWIFIARNEARAACERVKIPGFTVALISNGEWQAVARDIESVAANWWRGKFEEGMMANGHGTVGDPSSTLPVVDEADPYDGIVFTPDPWDMMGEYARWHRKRVLRLSTGEVLWDLSGNAEEWVYENKNEVGLDMDNFKDQVIHSLSERNKLLFGHARNYSFSTYYTMGFFSAWADTAITRGANSGLFSAGVGVKQDGRVKMWSGYGVIGFRCVARPVL